MATRRNQQVGLINTGASGLSNLVTNPITTGEMYIYQLYLSVSGACDLTSYDGNGPISGNINLNAAGAVLNFPDIGQPYLTVSSNANFRVNHDIGVRKTGFFVSPVMQPF